MSEFQEIPLGDFLELKRGYDLPSKVRESGEVPIVSSSGPSGFHNVFKAEAPGVVAGRYGTIGKVFYVPQVFWPLNTTLYVKDFKGNDPRFAYYLLKTIDWEKYNDKSGVPGVNRNDVHKELVKKPSLAQQKSISYFLGLLDDKIESNIKLNESIEALALALFRDWFFDFGPTRRKMGGATDPVEVMGGAIANADEAIKLAAHFPTQFRDGVPDGWQQRVLYDLCDWVNGAAFTKKNFSVDEGALPVIKIVELKNGVTEKTQYSGQTKAEKYKISNKEVLFSWSGNPETSIDTFIWSGGDAWLNQHIFAVRDKGIVDTSVLYFLLRLLKPEFAAIARDKQTTGLGHVTKHDLRSIPVHIGSSELLALAKSVFRPFFEQIYLNQTENNTLTNLRDLLLPKLINGDISITGDRESH